MRELNKEYPDADEDAIIERLAVLTLEQMHRDDGGAYLRGQHAKSTGCARA
jgi:hypothetical protein